MSTTPETAQIPQPNLVQEKDIRTHLLDYFSKVHDARYAADQMRKRTKRVTQVTMFLSGLVITAIPVTQTALTEAVDWQRMFEEEGLRFILPGMTLILLAITTPLWSNSWYRPLAIAMLAVAGTLKYFEIGHNAVLIALGALGIVILSFDLWDWWIDRKDQKNVPTIEQEIDAWIKTRFEGFIKTARPSLPVAATRLENATILKSFPKIERLKHIATHARIGTDNKPRISPLGLAAFDFGNTHVLVFEGALDLIENNVVYARLHEFRYTDIVSMVWSSDASPPDEATQESKRKRAIPLAKSLPQQKKKSKKAHITRDKLEIRLANNTALSIVFRDNTIHQNLANAPFEPIEELPEIRKVWERLREGKSAHHVS